MAVTPETGPPADYPRLTPELIVRDLTVSLAFYVDVLGGSVSFTRPGFAYLIVEGAHLMLEEFHPDGWVVGPLEPPFGRGVNFQIECGNASAMRRRLAAAGVTVFRDVRDTWYRCGPTECGARELLVQDPDGYLLRFAEHLGERVPGGQVT